jgi:hypothetical protein
MSVSIHDPLLSSFQAQAIAGRLVSPASQIEPYILGFQVLKQI